MIRKKVVHTVGPLLGLLLFAIALFVLHKELKAFSYHDVVRSLEALPSVHLYIALILTILNYLEMTGYDSLALRYIRYPLSYPKIAFASFIGYAFSTNIGLSMIAGSSVRYRLYSAWGLSAIEITKVVAFYTLALWLGLATVAGVMFLIEPLALPSLLHLPFSSIQPLGILFLTIGRRISVAVCFEKETAKDSGMGVSPPVRKTVSLSDHCRLPGLDTGRRRPLCPSASFHKSFLSSFS